MKSVHFSHFSPPIRASNPNNHTSSSSFSSSSITLLQRCKFSSVSLTSTSRPSRSITLCAPNSTKATSSSSSQFESAAAEGIKEASFQVQNDASQSHSVPAQDHLFPCPKAERDIAALPIANSVGTAAITRLVNATEVVQATKAKGKKAWSLKLNLATDGDRTLGFPTSTFHGLCEASF